MGYGQYAVALGGIVFGYVPTVPAQTQELEWQRISTNAAQVDALKKRVPGSHVARIRTPLNGIIGLPSRYRWGDRAAFRNAGQLHMVSPAVAAGQYGQQYPGFFQLKHQD